MCTRAQLTHATRAPPTQTPRSSGSAVVQPEADQVGLQPRREPAAVGEAGGARPARRSRPRARAARSPVRSPEPDRAEQQARRRVVRRQDVEQALRRRARRPRRCPNASRRAAGSARPSSPRRRAPGRRAPPRPWSGNSAIRAPCPAEAATCAAVVSSWLARTAPSRRAAATAAASCRAPLAGLQRAEHRRHARRSRRRSSRAGLACSAAAAASANWRWPGVWSIRLTMPTRSSAPNSSSSSSSVSEQISARRCSRWRMRSAPAWRSARIAVGDAAGVLGVAALAAAGDRADPQRVEDRRDRRSRPARRHGRGSRPRRPVARRAAAADAARDCRYAARSARARESRRSQIDRAPRGDGAARLDRRDPPVAHPQRAERDPAGQHEPRVGEDRLAGCARLRPWHGPRRWRSEHGRDFRRYAIYFAPRPRRALARFGAAWLGWDAEAGADRDGPELAGLPRPRAEIVATPRRYGFHATLKAPFRLARGATSRASTRRCATSRPRRAAFDAAARG